jgi:PAS domain S-box-containing protein
VTAQPSVAPDGAERFALAIVGNNDGVWDWDVPSGAVWFSDRWCRMLGYEPGEIAQHVSAWEVLLHPDDRDEVMTRLTDHLEGRTEQYETEHRLLARSGQWHWISDRGRVVSRAPDGQPLRMVGTHTDINYRKREAAARNVLLRLDEKLRGAGPEDACSAAIALIGEYLGSAQVGFGEIDDAQAHVIVHSDWNDGQLNSVIGTWRMDDFGPAFIREMKAGATVAIPDVTADRRTNTPEVMAAYSGIGVRAILDVPLVREGRMVAMLFVHHPEVRHWDPVEIATVERICDQLWFAVAHSRAIAALRKSESRFAIASLSVGFAAWEWDILSGRLEVSAGFDALYGRAGSSIRHIDEVRRHVHPELWTTLAERAFGAVTKGSAEGFDVDYRLADHISPTRWLRSIGAVTERDGAGRARKVHGFTTDISAQKGLERELNSLQDRLVRTNRLSAIGAIASTLTHELNQPLTAIVNALNVAKLQALDHPNSGAIGQALDRGTSAAFRLSETIRRVKRFALAGTVFKSAQSLSTLVSTARDFCVDQADRGRARLEMRVVIEQDQIDVDPIQFGQVLQNLIRNALDASSPDEGCVVTITSVRDGDTALITVEDNGAGIPATLRDTLFEPFQSENESGTGLGLAICRTLVEGHGGTIALAPSEHGARFQIRLPVA